MFGLPKLFVPRGVRQISTDTDTDSELLCVVFARCPVVVVCTEGTLFPEWADTHSYTHTYTRTASFRALDHTGFVTTGPTLIYVPFWNQKVWELPL
ncbi:MAG: hypothetical protein J07HQW1_01423 [Haloquadratum walsbyi J07HQW1]|uniref:Uncharacterized protein n=1 Tax=Haloquadratum walsbyi J07HQW1 TaxID=1238424 RepID=U1MNI4_9EURY|nr:MAG: hypothetical protein J07HQW1_01423 [Haloquadratum walsbyi J07HQW1]